MSGFIYIASPYSGTVKEMKERFEAVERYTAYAMKHGEVVFSPIVHCHEIAAKYSMPTDFGFWENYCLGMLEGAHTFRILTLDGWRDSTGVLGEWEMADEWGHGIEFVDPNTYEVIDHDDCI